MKYEIRMRPGGEFEEFEQDAFGVSIGKELSVTPNTKGKILRVLVSSDGSYADILIEVPDDSDAATLMKEAETVGEYTLEPKENNGA